MVTFRIFAISNRTNVNIYNKSTLNKFAAKYADSKKEWIYGIMMYRQAGGQNQVM